MISTKREFKEGRPRLFIVGQDLSYYRPWASLFSLADELEEADVAMFTGGADVSPEIYGQKNNGLSYCSPDRDQRELATFKQIKAMGIGMIGICRGSQFITAANGGMLYQHVDNHALTNGHNIITEDGKKFFITSTHHQMMRPAGEFRIIAWTEPRSKVYLSDDYKDATPATKVDPEIVWYPKIRALCIQGHPEFLPADCEVNQYCRTLARDLLL